MTPPSIIPSEDGSPDDRNMPDWAAEETARLELEYVALKNDVAAILAEARAVPPTVDNEETANIYTKLIKRIRDLDNRVEAMRENEKAPHLRRVQADDSFFFRLRERLARRKKNDTPGGADVLLSRLNYYNSRRLAEEQRRRDAEARRARQEAELAQAAAAEVDRQRREAEASAARARNAEKIAEHQAEAARLADESDRARAAERMASDTAAAAGAEARAKASDMVRERHSSGALNTMREVWHVEIIDPMKLDAAALWAFVKDDAKLAALTQWAKVTQYRRSMEGALIEKRPETTVR